jgi:two-component system, NtrC family, response regulator HydG
MSERSYHPRDLVRHASDSLIAIDARKRILSMNPSAEALTGLSEAEAQGQPCSEILSSSLCEDGCPFERAFGKAEQITSFDVRVNSRAGEQIPVCVNTSILKNDHGEAIGIVESIRDIRRILELIQERETARQNAEKTATQLSAVLETSDDAVIAVDPECHITSFNRTAETLFQYTRDEVMGRHSNQLCKAEFCALEVTLDEKRALPGGELHLRVRDGSVIPVWMKTELLRDAEGTVIGAVAIHRDRREVKQLHQQFKDEHGMDRLIGKSAPMRNVYRRIEQVAPTDSTVLVLGESGTGKELVAEILHAQSQRWDRTLVKVNCAALPDNLLESELFGHVRGAFTSAVADRIGRFELAHRGTIFLDEIGDLPLPLQVKLLRVLQEREFERVGSAKTTKVDLRILAATNRNLGALVAAGEFREDLYYRLNVVPIELPPLRSHAEDVPLISGSILAKLAVRSQRPAKQLTPQTMKALMDYDWPGNVRELENALEYAVVTSVDDWIQPGDLPPRMAVKQREGNGTLAAAVSTAETDLLVAALRGASSTEEAARRLGVSRATLWRKMKKFGVSLARVKSQ